MVHELDYIVPITYESFEGIMIPPPLTWFWWGKKKSEHVLFMNKNLRHITCFHKPFFLCHQPARPR